jgi:hypothetical protein
MPPCDTVFVYCLLALGAYLCIIVFHGKRAVRACVVVVVGDSGRGSEGGFYLTCTSQANMMRGGGQAGIMNMGSTVIACRPVLLK